MVDTLNLPAGPADLEEWKTIVARDKHPQRRVKIAVVGKYVELLDAYLSVSEALTHAGIFHNAKVDFQWVQSSDINETNAAQILQEAAGILVPGGFGDRGIEGKIAAIRYAREHRVPFFGICLGMQLAVVEFARHVAGLPEAQSSEFKPEGPQPVIHIMPEQKDINDKGGTMRLGLYPCKIHLNTKAREAYGEDLIYERHRHRYEFNNEYRDQLTEKGLMISGISPDERLVEIIELKDHPWFVAGQFHPEFKSRPTRPHPLFRDFVKAALEK